MGNGLDQLKEEISNNLNDFANYNIRLKERVIHIVKIITPQQHREVHDYHGTARDPNTGQTIKRITKYIYYDAILIYSSNPNEQRYINKKVTLQLPGKCWYSYYIHYVDNISLSEPTTFVMSKISNRKYYVTIHDNSKDIAYYKKSIKAS